MVRERLGAVAVRGGAVGRSLGNRQEFVDRVTGVFTPVVIAISLVTLVVWMSLAANGDIPEDWIPVRCAPVR